MLLLLSFRWRLGKQGPAWVDRHKGEPSSCRKPLQEQFPKGRSNGLHVRWQVLLGSAAEPLPGIIFCLVKTKRFEDPLHRAVRYWIARALVDRFPRESCSAQGGGWPHKRPFVFHGNSSYFLLSMVGENGWAATDILRLLAWVPIFFLHLAKILRTARSCGCPPPWRASRPAMYGTFPRPRSSQQLLPSWRSISLMTLSSAAAFATSQGGR